MEFRRFGRPQRFEIAVRWTIDFERRARLPAYAGASMGELELTVGQHVITLHQHAGKNRNAVKWYLLPVFEWLAKNWISLFHEEHYSWRENSAAPAATTSFLTLRRLIAIQDDKGSSEYAQAQAWWQRHALRAADSSALYPDLFFRRLADDIELSWTSRQPIYAPDGFRFALTPGVAMLPVADVAQPLWEALNWVVETAPASTTEDFEVVAQLRKQLEILQSTPTKVLEASYLSKNLLTLIASHREALLIPDESTRVQSVPVIDHFDDAVLMFGGVNPDIGGADVQTLMKFLASNRGAGDGEKLGQLVDDSIGAPVAAPFEEGYDLADEVLSNLGLPQDISFIDIRSVLTGLKVRVEEFSLQTSAVRGVAVAGPRYSPAILVNTSSQYNRTEDGKRFTLAHELFHILFDRVRAKRVTHSSGPWASPAVEKRANAFAAMLLMPRVLVRTSVREIVPDQIAIAAKSMQVGQSALIEHLFNINMIDETEREQLRSSLTRE